MGLSGTTQTCLGKHMPDWIMLDTGLCYGFYQLIYVPGLMNFIKASDINHVITKVMGQ
jgi:hypothetical protein